MCAHICVMCGEPESDVNVFPHQLFTSFFETGPLTEPVDYQYCQADCLVISRKPLISVAPALELQAFVGPRDQN